MMYCYSNLDAIYAKVYCIFSIRYLLHVHSGLKKTSKGNEPLTWTALS